MAGYRIRGPKEAEYKAMMPSLRLEGFSGKQIDEAKQDISRIEMIIPHEFAVLAE